MLPSKHKMENLVSIRSCFLGLQILTMLVTSAQVWPTTAGEEKGNLICHLYEIAAVRLMATGRLSDRLNYSVFCS